MEGILFVLRVIGFSTVDNFLTIVTSLTDVLRVRMLVGECKV